MQLDEFGEVLADHCVEAAQNAVDRLSLDLFQVENFEVIVIRTFLLQVVWYTLDDLLFVQFFEEAFM